MRATRAAVTATTGGPRAGPPLTHADRHRYPQPHRECDAESGHATLKFTAARTGERKVCGRLPPGISLVNGRSARCGAPCTGQNR